MKLKFFILTFECEFTEKIYKLLYEYGDTLTKTESKRIFKALQRSSEFNKKSFKYMKDNEIHISSYINFASSFLAKEAYKREVLNHKRKNDI